MPLPLRLLNAFGRGLDLLCTGFGLALGLLVALMCIDVGARNLGLGSLSWLTELAEYLIYAGTFLAAPFVLRQGAHVRVDILLTALPRSLAFRLEQALDLAGMAIALVLLWQGGFAVLDAFRNNMVQFKTWNTPEWLLLTAIPVGAALLAIEFCLRLARVEGVVRAEIDPAQRPSF